MNDMRTVIAPKSDQINADDLLSGPMTITIRSVSIRPGTEQPISVHFDGDNNKPWKPCKSMARVMVHCWGADANAYVGRSLTLYCDPKVLWGGMAVGGIRISAMSHISETHTMALTATKGKRAPFTVRPLKEAPVAAQSAAPDKVADGVHALVARIEAADQVALEAITSDPAVTKQREWLEKNRPDLAVKVALAITDALAAIDAVSTVAGADALPTDPP